MTTEVISFLAEMTSRKFQNSWTRTHIITGAVAQAVFALGILLFYGPNWKLIYSLVNILIFGVLIGISQHITLGRRFKRWAQATVIATVLAGLILIVGAYCIRLVEVKMVWTERVGASAQGETEYDANLAEHFWAVANEHKKYQLEIAVNNFFYNIGVPVSNKIFAFVVFSIGDTVRFLIWGGVVGAGIGLAQFFILRRYLPRAGRWWAANLIAGAVSQLLMIYFCNAYTVVIFWKSYEGWLSYIAGSILTILGGLIYGAVYGAITGKVWARLWHSLQPVEQQHDNLSSTI